MNSLKNMMILAVLAAVGYGVYVSLSRSNLDSATSSFDATDSWTNTPKSESNTESPKVGRPLALGDGAPRTASSGGLGVGGTDAGDLAPPLAQSPPETPATDPSVATSTTPYPSSGSSSTSPTEPSQAALDPPTASNTIGSSPTTDASSSTVRNLAPPPGAASGGPENHAADSAEGLLQKKFAAFMIEVRKSLDAGRLAEAHLALSALYTDPRLPEEQAKQVIGLLDQVAGTVIYSQQHYLEPPYRTRQGDTIEKVARGYNVPWQLLAKINGLMPPEAANTETSTKDLPLPIDVGLKVVRGPFGAVVRLDKRELVLTIPDRATGQQRYAGRFPIGIGVDQPKLDGEYTVCSKMFDPTYRGPDGVAIAPRDPRNPLGDAWIGLNERIGIHGTDDPRNIGRDGNRGNICVGRRDLQDLYGILTVGSRVTIVR